MRQHLPLLRRLCWKARIKVVDDTDQAGCQRSRGCPWHNRLSLGDGRARDGKWACGDRGSAGVGQRQEFGGKQERGVV
ncbi:uncharacterized protein LOC142575917 isoform X2 [Dermacentor variabilis]|uniref:uncharacterized protein LOC142575917 isoform X2 n=1 Tax=Dermacentor variabilis TaxID=34621 RepID=UPI003F5C22E8